jgi:hypothetical protein
MMDCCFHNAPPGGCRQGRDCPLRSTETAIERRARIALPDRVLMEMIDRGHILGPYRPTRPLVVNAMVRFGRAVINAYTNRRSA